MNEYGVHKYVSTTLESSTHNAILKSCVSKYYAHAAFHHKEHIYLFELIGIPWIECVFLCNEGQLQFRQDYDDPTK